MELYFVFDTLYFIHMADKDYKKLTDFIGEQFTIVHGKFDRVYDEFGAVHKRIDVLEFKFDDLKSDFRQLQSSVDAYANKANTYFQELAAMGNKLNRHEKWISQIAKKLHIKLS